MTFKVVAVTVDSGIDFELLPDAKGFQKQWLFVDASTRNPLLLTPRVPAEPNSGWGHVKLVDRWLTHVWKRLDRLQTLGVTSPMVLKEFVRQRIALLQHHSRLMWTFTSAEDSMRLQEPTLTSKTISKVLELLAGDSKPTDLPRNGCLLYQGSNKVAFVEQMPLFDEWGLLLEGLEGPRENPILVAPLLLDPAVHAPSVLAGRCTPPAAAEGTSGGPAPSSAPEAETPGTQEGTTAGLTQPDALEAEAPEARGDCSEVVADGEVPPDVPDAAARGTMPSGSALEATTQGAPPSSPAHEAASQGTLLSAPAPGDRHSRPGQLCLNLGALLKRKGSLSRSGDARRPLKLRKYMVVDE